MMGASEAEARGGRGMIVDKVRNATTANSEVVYQVTLRIWGDDLETAESDAQLANLVRKAINGIADYPIERKP